MKKIGRTKKKTKHFLNPSHRLDAVQNFLPQKDALLAKERPSMPHPKPSITNTKTISARDGTLAFTLGKIRRERLGLHPGSCSSSIDP